MLVNSQPLYRLSYWGTFFIFKTSFPGASRKAAGKNSASYILQVHADVNNFHEIFRPYSGAFALPIHQHFRDGLANQRVRKQNLIRAAVLQLFRLLGGVGRDYNQGVGR